MKSRDIQPADLDPERRRGTTLPTTSLPSTVTSTDSQRQGRSFGMNGFFPGLIAGALAALLGMYIFYRADVQTLNRRWEEAGKNAASNAQSLLDDAIRARKEAEGARRKSDDALVEMKNDRDRATTRADGATKQIDAVRRAARRKSGEKDSDKAAALDQVRDALGE